MIIEESIDIAGKTRVTWQQPSGKVYFFKFDNNQTTAQIKSIADEKETIEQYNNVIPIINNELKKSDIISLIQLIKERPGLTSTQLNTYFSNIPWYEELKIRTAIYEIGIKLAERKEISLSIMTEAQFLLKVRDFIVNTPIKKLAKLFLNQLDI